MRASGVSESRSGGETYNGMRANLPGRVTKSYLMLRNLSSITTVSPESLAQNATLPTTPLCPATLPRELLFIRSRRCLLEAHGRTRKSDLL